MLLPFIDSTKFNFLTYVIDNKFVNMRNEMPKPEILQVGPFPEWVQVPLDQEFTMH